MPTWPTYMTYLPDLPTWPAYMTRLPDLPTCLSDLPTCPTHLTYPPDFIYTPNLPTWAIHLTNLSDLTSWLTYLTKNISYNSDINKGSFTILAMLLNMFLRSNVCRNSKCWLFWECAASVTPELSVAMWAIELPSPFCLVLHFHRVLFGVEELRVASLPKKVKAKTWSFSLNIHFLAGISPSSTLISGRVTTN